MGQTEHSPLNASLSRLKYLISPTIGLAVFLASLVVIRTELRAVGWHDLRADILVEPPSRLALALMLTALNYAVLTGYDLETKVGNFRVFANPLISWVWLGTMLLAFGLGLGGFAVARRRR